jgi:alpha-ketoglutarate-dependent taurine dioxygenase
MPEFSRPFREQPITVAQAIAGETLAEISESVILEKLTETAVLVRGFPPDIAAFNIFAKRFCSTSVFNESPDRLVLDSKNNIQSVNLGDDPFPLHPELSRVPWKPDICFFNCITAPSEGGETTFCDGVELARRLPCDVRSVLEERSLLYIQHAGPPVLKFWLGTSEPSDAVLANPPAGCPYGFRRVGHGIVRFFARPSLHKPLWSDELAFGNFLLFAREYLKIDRIPLFEDGSRIPDWIVEAVKEAADPITFAVAWQAGDILILDNSRFMHGRNAITDQGERLIATYFGYLNGVKQRPDEIANPPWREVNFRPPGVKIQPTDSKE